MVSGSMDMFWLVNAVRYGLPGALLFSIPFVVILVQLMRNKTEDETFSACRKGLIISIVGLSLAGWTVHYWNSTYVLLMFLLGSGVWMLDVVPGGGPAEPGTEKSASDSGRSRRTRSAWTRTR